MQFKVLHFHKEERHLKMINDLSTPFFLHPSSHLAMEPKQWYGLARPRWVLQTLRHPSLCVWLMLSFKGTASANTLLDVLKCFSGPGTLLLLFREELVLSSILFCVQIHTFWPITVWLMLEGTSGSYLAGGQQLDFQMCCNWINYSNNNSNNCFAI